MIFVIYDLKMIVILFLQILYVYKESIFYFLYRKCRLDIKLEDVIGLELMEMLMFERKINVYFDDLDGILLFFLKDFINYDYVRNINYWF